MVLSCTYARRLYKDFCRSLPTFLAAFFSRVRSPRGWQLWSCTWWSDLMTLTTIWIENLVELVLQIPGYLIGFSRNSWPATEKYFSCMKICDLRPIYLLLIHITARITRESPKKILRISLLNIFYRVNWKNRNIYGRINTGFAQPKPKGTNRIS